MGVDVWLFAQKYSHTLSVWHSEMKDMRVLPCCSRLLVNNKFIFITVQYVKVCVCVWERETPKDNLHKFIISSFCFPRKRLEGHGLWLTISHGNEANYTTWKCAVSSDNQCKNQCEPIKIRCSYSGHIHI